LVLDTRTIETNYGAANSYRSPVNGMKPIDIAHSGQNP